MMAISIHYWCNQMKCIACLRNLFLIINIASQSNETNFVIMKVTIH